MDLKKLKLDKFTRIQIINFPERYNLGIDSVSENPEVIIYYMDQLSDMADFIATIQSADLPKDNRVIFVYEKGRKDGVNRDTLYAPFASGEAKGFKMRQPMMCSLSEKLSAFVQSYQGV